MSREGTIGVVGAGAWGTALANAAARAGRKVVLWARDRDQARSIEIERENRARLPGIPLEPGVRATAALGEAVNAAAVLVVVPAQALRGVVAEMAPAMRARLPVVVCAKGIERGTGRFMTQVVAETAPAAVPAILSGPSFAADVGRGLPTAVTLAAADAELAEGLGQALSSGRFRVYHGTDVRGVEIGGAAKNVLAIAAGIVAGRRLGESARAAIVARGFAELRRFAAAHGGRPETLMGLSGLGDLVLTCGSAQSRNFAFGLALGEGRTVAEASGGKLAEGAFTAEALVGMARDAHVEVPISEAIAAVLRGECSIDAAVDGLMNRPLRSEI